MTDQELADKVVALDLGYVQYDQQDKFAPYFISFDRYDDRKVAAEVLVRDWRVAGALMQKALHDGPDGDLYVGWCPDKEFWVVNDDYTNDSPIITGESLPRAIIEACVEALS